MLFDFGSKKLDIVHEEIQDDWLSLNIEFDDSLEDRLVKFEKELNKNNLTLNDFFIAVLKDAIANPETSLLFKDLQK